VSSNQYAQLLGYSVKIMGESYISNISGVDVLRDSQWRKSAKESHQATAKYEPLFHRRIIILSPRLRLSRFATRGTSSLTNHQFETKDDPISPLPLYARKAHMSRFWIKGREASMPLRPKFRQTKNSDNNSASITMLS